MCFNGGEGLCVTAEAKQNNSLGPRSRRVCGQYGNMIPYIALAYKTMDDR